MTDAPVEPEIAEVPDNSTSSSSCDTTFLHSGYQNGILVYGWNATTDWQFAGTMAAAFFIAFVFEFVRCTRNRYLIKKVSLCQKRQWTLHVFTTILYGIQSLIGICLLLMINTFHVWICLSIVTGLALGCLCFSVTSVSFTLNLGQEHCFY
jgi:hypothetical protein